VVVLIYRSKARRREYHDSESYWFSKMMKQNDKGDLLNHLYYWLDRSSLPFKNKTLENLAADDQILSREVEELKKDMFSSKQQVNYDISTIKKRTSAQRRTMKSRKVKLIPGNRLEDLNP
jgi:hypothetical protein